MPDPVDNRQTHDFTRSQPTGSLRVMSNPPLFFPRKNYKAVRRRPIRIVGSLGGGQILLKRGLLGRPRRPKDSVSRQRWQLWFLTFVVIAAMAIVLFYVSSTKSSEVLRDIPFLPFDSLRVALLAMLAGLAVYVFDRERHLRRLSDRLTEERIESTRLATELQYLTELQRERDTNAALLDGSADGVAVCDAQLRLVRFNDAMESLCGTSATRALGGYAPAMIRFASSDGAPLEGDHYPPSVVLAGGGPQAGVELRLRLADGAERWVSGTFSPVSDTGNDRPVLVMLVLRDITAQKEVEAVQRDFVSIVSHELRSPLTAIKGFAKTLLQRDRTLDGETRRQFLTTVNEQADRLAWLTEDILQVSRIDARRLRLRKEDINVMEIVVGLLEQFESKWDRPFVLDVPAGVAAVRADRRKFEEILINLIDNAIKYSPAGSEIRVGARTVGGQVEIAVEDHGIGISPEDATRLFQKFQRITTPATRDIGGTGLGLYIVKGLVEAQGGRVWVESVPGVGSTFAFALGAAASAAKGQPAQEASA
jgi:PAS domain S-box-containing protein